MGSNRHSRLPALNRTRFIELSPGRQANTFLIVVFALLLLTAAYVVFRQIVRKDYLENGRLSKKSSFLQLLIFFCFFCFPYLYNPRGWDFFWKFDVAAGEYFKVLGFILILLGFLVAFGTMFWFGIRRAFGLTSEELVQSGPYRFSRNPQILGGYLLVMGVAVQCPSWFALGWLLIYAAICHMMIITEEEHLSLQFGEEYIQYCSMVPRYLGRKKKIFQH